MTLANWTDISVVVVIVFSIAIGMWRGFVKEALSLSTWVVAIWLAVMFHENMSYQLSNLIHNEMVRSIAAFGSVFTLVLLVGSLCTYLIAMLVKKSGITGTDRLMGLVFGMTRGVVLVTLVLTVLSYTGLRNASWWHESVAITKFKPLMAWMNDIIPERLNGMKDSIKTATTPNPKSAVKAHLFHDNSVGLDALAEVNLLEEDE